MRPLAVSALIAALLAAGCGRDDSPEAQARRVVERFADATAAKDYQRICDDLLAERLTRALGEQGLPCELALQTGLEQVQSPKLTIRSIRVQGDTALARVRTDAANQPSSEDTLRLVREDGEWRIASLAGGR